VEQPCKGGDMSCIRGPFLFNTCVRYYVRRRVAGVERPSVV
jgi:hypothetical protein